LRGTQPLPTLNPEGPKFIAADQVQILSGAIKVEKLLSPLSLKVLSFLFPELPVKGEKRLWDDLLTACPKLLGELREKRLTPLIYMQLLQRNQHQKLPPAFLRELSQDYASALKTAARQEKAAGQVIKSFHQAGIDFLLLKGADLRIRLYGDASLRPMSDLDLLISPRDISRVRSLLENLGFSLEFTCEKRPGFRQAFGKELHFLPPSGDSLMVDVHWEVFGLDHFYYLSFEPLWNKSVLLDFQGIPVRVLSPEHALIHLCLHTFRDDSLIHLIDLALALRTFPISWPYLLDEVKHFRCPAPVYLILQAMAQISPVLVPESVLNVLSNYQPSWAEKLVLHRTWGYFTRHFSDLYHHCTFSEWFFYISSMLWPQRDYLVAIYGKPDRVRFVRQFFKTLFSSANNWSPH